SSGRLRGAVDPRHRPPARRRRRWSIPRLIGPTHPDSGESARRVKSRRPDGSANGGLPAVNARRLASPEQTILVIRSVQGGAIQRAGADAAASGPAVLVAARPKGHRRPADCAFPLVASSHAAYPVNAGVWISTLKYGASGLNGVIWKARY